MISFIIQSFNSAFSLLSFLVTKAQLIIHLISEIVRNQTKGLLSHLNSYTQHLTHEMETAIETNTFDIIDSDSKDVVIVRRALSDIPVELLYFYNSIKEEVVKRKDSFLSLYRKLVTFFISGYQLIINLARTPINTHIEQAEKVSREAMTDIKSASNKALSAVHEKAGTYVTPFSEMVKFFQEKEASLLDNFTTTSHFYVERAVAYKNQVMEHYHGHGTKAA